MNRFALMKQVRPLLFLLVTVLSIPAMAGVVGNGNTGSCNGASLAAQISAGGTVTFNCGSGPQTITLTSGIFINSTNPKVTVDGGDTITLDGTGLTSGMLSVSGSSTVLPDVTFKHITFANGNINTGLNAGGTIQNFGNLTLDTVTIRNSQSQGGGGAIFQELCTGCLTASLTITHCQFLNNTSVQNTGGALDLEGGDATVADSTFSGNAGGAGAAISVYGNSTFRTVVSIDRCTFTGNSARFAGGAISVNSLNSGSSLTITNDTFTGNTATQPGGQGSALDLGSAPVTITNCTIAGNTAAAGGGAIHFAQLSPLTAMNNTIIASNSGGNCALDSGAVFTGGHNLQFGDSTCTGVTVNNPLLSPLANNGGLTQTMALGAGSPAIDGGESGVAPPTDQRGVARTDGNGDGIVTADIGAFEASAAPNPNPPPKRHRAVKPQ